MNVTHTPTPWAFNPETRQIFNTADGVVVDMDYSDQDASVDVANATLIVRAVNAHNKLVGALSDAKELLALNGIDINDNADYGNGRADDIVSRISAALDAAGEPV